MADGWRNVIREAEFEEQLAALRPWDPTGDEYLAAAEELLARDPLAGAFVAASPQGNAYWELPLPPIGDRTIVLYYTFTETAVHFVWVVALDVEC